MMRDMEILDWNWVTTVVGVSSAIAGGLGRDICNIFIPSRAEIRAKKEREKRIKDIVDEIPNSLWVKEGDRMLWEDFAPITMSTNSIKKAFFAGENLSIDEVYDELLNLKNEGRITIVEPHSMHKKHVLWEGAKLDVIGMCTIKYKNGVIGIGAEKPHGYNLKKEELKYD